MWTFHLTFGFISFYADIRLRLFLENLIRENRRKWSKSLPALKVFLLKNGVNTSKDQGHFMRIFGHAYFWKTSYEKIAWSGQNPYRRWRCFYWKTASTLPALKVFSLKNCFNTGKDWVTFSEKARNYEKIAWSGQNPYRRWRCFYWKTASTLPALKVFSLKNCFNTGKDWVTFSEKARMRLSKNRPIFRN